jgi:hypothetical protein
LLKTELHDDYLGEDLGAYGTLRVEVLELDQEDCDFSVGDVGNGLADSLNLEVDLEVPAGGSGRENMMYIVEAV